MGLFGRKENKISKDNEKIIQKYNKIPFTESVNTDLTDYVTKEALKGVYKMIAIEEAQIRTQLSSRTTTLLQQVF